MRRPLLPVAAVLLAASSGAQNGRPAEPVRFPDRTIAIMNGDYPDPSIVRDGDDFYMTHSSFDYVPGLLIWHSKDLQHWTPIARPLHRRLRDLWAPDFIKYQGLFYIYFPASGTNWVITAKTPYGPWTEPVDLKVRGIDPGHVATQDGKRYLYLNNGLSVPLASDGLSVQGKPEHVYNGWNYPEDWSVECFCLESPKFTTRDGYYYLTSAEGGTAGPSTSHMAVLARSRDALGPWENSPLNPLIHTLNSRGPWRSTGHGTIFDAGQGRWFIVYHGYENGHLNMGRYTLLSPISWTPDSWVKALPEPTGQPVVIRNHGIQSDEFTGDSLNLQWQFSGVATSDEFTVKDGAVTIATGPTGMKVLNTQSGDHNYEASVSLEPDPGTEAGLILYYSPEVYAGIATTGGKVVNLRRGRYEAPRVECADCRYLKIRLVDDDLSTYYSADGKTWKKHPSSMDVSGYQTNVLGGFSSIHLGIYGKGGGNVKIRHFSYRALP